VNFCTHLLLKCTLINLPERRERKAPLATYGCFSRSLINAVREAKEQGTLLLKPSHPAPAGLCAHAFRGMFKQTIFHICWFIISK